MTRKSVFYVALLTVSALSLALKLRSADTPPNPFSRVLCGVCETGCLKNPSTPDDGGGCISFDELPLPESGDCDPQTYPDPPCIVESRCSLSGKLRFHLVAPCSGQWYYREVHDGAPNNWIDFISGAGGINFNPTQDASKITCGGSYRVEFSYGAGHQYMSSALYEVKCTTCEGSTGTEGG